MLEAQFKNGAPLSAPIRAASRIAAMMAEDLPPSLLRLDRRAAPAGARREDGGRIRRGHMPEEPPAGDPGLGAKAWKEAPPGRRVG